MRGKFLLAGALLALAVPELAYYIGSLAPGPLPKEGSCGVLALGFPPRRDGSPHPVQRYRVDAAADLFRKESCSVLVISGGHPHSRYIEAETMGKLALDRGVPPDKLILEKTSRDTWENVRLSIPRLEGTDRIFLVSDSLHALRAKRYLCRQRRDLCSKAYPYGPYQPAQLYGMRWFGILHELGAFLRDCLFPFKAQEARRTP